MNSGTNKPSQPEGPNTSNRKPRAKRSPGNAPDVDPLYVGLFEDHPMTMLMIDPNDGKIVDVNRQAEAYYGWPREQMRRMNINEINALSPEEILDRMARTLAEGSQKHLFRHRLSNGEVRNVEVSSGPMHLKGRRLLCSTVVDISLRVNAFHALKETETNYREQAELLNAIFENIPVLLACYDEAGEFLWSNREWEHVFGWPIQDMRGRDMLAEFYPDAAIRAEVSAAMQVQSKEWRVHATRTRDGRDIDISWICVRISHGRFVSFGQDVTEQRRLEQQLRQSQKMEGIGRLAGGIAHDFNNLLTAIAGFTYLAESDLDPNDPCQAHLANVQKAAWRAAELTRQLLAFARKQIMNPRILDLNRLMIGVDKILRRLLGEDIELVMLLATDLGNVCADEGQIEQVLLNLAINARDAMPEGGTLTIETANVYLDEDYARRHPGSKPGMHVMAAVSDTGTGISEEVKSHVFEPFFTTKEPGKGTGLGLATSYGIVKQCQGSIYCYSELGRGSSFKVYLPRVDEAAEDRVVEPVQIMPEGTETVLIAEDEPQVRRLAAQALRAWGYQVIEAEAGDDAYRMATEFAGELHLLLTDVIMPRMGGKELAARLLEVRPNLRVLFTSGYTNNAIVHFGVLDSGISFLQKPFTLSALAQRVRQTLDAS